MKLLAERPTLVLPTVHSQPRKRAAWDYLSGAALVIVANITAFTLWMPLFVALIANVLTLERVWFVGGVLVMPYIVLQSVIQFLVFLPMYLSFKTESPRLAKAVLASATLFLAFGAITLALLLAAEQSSAAVILS